MHRQPAADDRLLAETLGRIDADLALVLPEIERDLAETMAQFASAGYPESDPAMVELRLENGVPDRNRIGMPRRARQMAGGSGADSC